VTILFTRKTLPLKLTLGMWKLLCEDYAAGEEAGFSLSEEEEPSDVDPLDVGVKSTEEKLETPPAERPLLPADAEEESDEESDEEAGPKRADKLSPLTMQLLLATAATDGDPSTSPFHDVLGEQNSQGFLEAEAFLEAGGNEVTAALLQVVGDFDGRDPILQRLARKAGTYVKQLEQFEFHMTWSKDRIEAISKQVAEAKDSSMTW
jgi:hypothetical protein